MCVSTTPNPRQRETPLLLVLLCRSDARSDASLSQAVAALWTVLWDSRQLPENKQQVQGRLPAAGRSLGWGLKEDSSKPQTYRDSSTLQLQVERNPVLYLKVLWLLKCVLKLMCVICGPLHGCASIPGFYCADIPAFRWKRMMKLMKNRLTLY